MIKKELYPTDGRKSFYGKAYTITSDNGDEVLYSYNTAIIKKAKSGELFKLWNGWTATTGRHIKAFCEMNKAKFLKLKAEG